MAKSALKLEAIKLRKRGESVRDIAKKLGVVKSTVSLWVRDVILTIEQAEKLNANLVAGGHKGRLISALLQKKRRLEKIETENQRGERQFTTLTPKELQIAGLCLYWAEGSKKSRTIVICNSDPNIILAFIGWLQLIYGITLNELKCAVGINEAHRNRERVVKNYWAKTTGIPLSNFTKTSFKKYPLRKLYDNFNEHYGTLAVKLLKPGKIYYRVLGEIHGLSKTLSSLPLPG